MKTLKKLILITFIGVMGSLKAQEDPVISSLEIESNSYNTAIGLRAGETSGLTVKHFIRDRKALEGILGLSHHGVSATLLFEFYAPAFDVSGMNWYYGAGGHLGFLRAHRFYNYRYNLFYDRYPVYDFGIGVDGIFGLEYKIPQTPIALSLDLKPYIEFNTVGGTWASLDPGFGFKVTF